MAVGCIRATENAVEAARNRVEERANGGTGRAATGTEGRFEKVQWRGHTQGVGKHARPTGWKGGRALGCALDSGRRDRNGEGEEDTATNSAGAGDRTGPWDAPVARGGTDRRGAAPSMVRDADWICTGQMGDGGGGAGRLIVRRGGELWSERGDTDARDGGNGTGGPAGTCRSGAGMEGGEGGHGEGASPPPPSPPGGESGASLTGLPGGRCADMAV